MGELITVAHDSKTISIEIPLKLLVYAQEWREDTPFLILDTDKMANFITQNILDYTENTLRAQETGESDFSNLLDALFRYAYEDGEDWLVRSAYGERGFKE